MPYVLMILTAIAGAGFLYWRIRMASAAAREIAQLAGDARAAARRFGFNRKFAGHPAETIDDPRLCAASMMVAMASHDGPLTREQLDAVAAACAREFGVAADEAADMAAFGRWIAGHSKDPDDTLRRLARTLRPLVGPEEKRSLIAMLNEIACVAGEVTDIQAQAIRRISDSLGE